MKKRYLIVLMAALLVLFGCAQPDPTSNAVSFSRSIESGEGASGSQQESFEAGDTTMLWAWSGEYAGRYDVASGVRSIFDGSTWSQDGAVYWNGEGEHTFIGASPALDITNPRAYGFDTPEDILWARTSASKSDGTVALEFSHAFAKLRFEIKYASCYDGCIEDAEASIVLADSGTMNFVEQTFSPAAGTTEVTLKNVSVDKESRTAVYEAIVIPQTVSTSGINFNIHGEGNAFEGTEETETITLESNKVTTVEMTLDNYGISYGGITVTDWEVVAGTGSAENPELKGLTIVPGSASNVMQDGETLQLEVVPVPATAKPGTVTWTVVEGPVAVDENGCVSLKDGAGSNSSAVVKATCDGLEAEITINIKPDYVVENDVWNIYTAQGLLKWHENPTSAKLMADITLPDPEEGQTSNWTPVCIESPYSSYTGTFDGNGHTISNIKIVSGDYFATGFIGYLSGTVKNLTLSGCEIKITVEDNSGASRYIGAVAGALYGGTVENCTASGDVTISGSASGTTYAGGIAGYTYADNDEISNCSSAATVSATGSSYNYAGGIIGSSDGVLSGCSSSGEVTASGGSNDYAGGITGNNGGTIAGCSSYANVTGGCAGGIAGTSSYAIIIGCEYHSDGSTSDSSKISSTKSNGGGIVGLNSNNGKVISCWSTGNVTNMKGCYPFLGGIAGSNYATVDTCYWSVPAGSSTNYDGIGNDSTSETVKKVDGSEGNTWADATSAMNDAITVWNGDNNNGCGYHFEQNAEESEPPVIAEGAPATT